MFPVNRLRRLRKTETLRNLISETRIDIDKLILPLFVVPGKRVRNAIKSMPGSFKTSIDELVKDIESAYKSGIKSIILFGIPEKKDAIGSAGYSKTGIIPRAIKSIKKDIPDMLIIADVCMCEYTSHGHCGIIRGNPPDVDNDETLKKLAQASYVYADAGADIIAPSDMMDGRVKSIRDMLDSKGFINTPIMSYAAKYSSAFYGPFRDAAESAPSFGDRRTYQMDPRNADEAMREIDLDIGEGADIIMVKPALSYLDIVRRVKERYNLPIAAYNVSGEYSMVKAAARLGWIDEKRVALEILTSIFRAGADMILTYWARDVAKWIKEN